MESKGKEQKGEVKPKARGMERGMLDPRVVAIHAGLSFKSDENVTTEKVLKLFEQIESDLKEIRSGDFSLIEEHLYSQGIALQAMFHLMITNCMESKFLEGQAAYGKMALKAQSQSRQTLLALAEHRNPRKATFIKQQNNAVNQQVNNNSPTKASVKKSEKTSNELLKETKYEALDSRGTEETIRVNSKVEAVGVLHRP